MKAVHDGTAHAITGSHTSCDGLRLQTVRGGYSVVHPSFIYSIPSNSL